MPHLPDNGVYSVNEARGAKDILGILFWGIMSVISIHQSPTICSTSVRSQGDDDDEPSNDDDDDTDDEETKPFEMDESTTTPPSPSTHRTTARISIVDGMDSMPIPSEGVVVVDDILPLTNTPFYYPSSHLSPPSAEVNALTRSAMGRLESLINITTILSPPIATIHLTIPPPHYIFNPPYVPTSLPLPSSPLPPLLASPTLFIPPPVDRREDILEAELPPRKRLCLTALISRPTGGHKVDYGFIGTLNAKTKRQRAKEVSYGIRDVWDRQFHQETALLLDQEALASREVWAHSVGLSSAVHFELQAYRTHTQMQDYRIASHESLTAALIAQNNMPQRRSSVTARATAARSVAVAAAAPITDAAVEQLIKARVSAALDNHETL
ncbi:hypothetical protein Tco_1437346 [Tanacetum coccineum]